MPREFRQDAVASSTQIGPGGTRIASAGGRSETRNASDAALARHGGANATANSDFVTLSQLNARTATFDWTGSVNTQDPVQTFLNHPNNVGLGFTVQDANTLFQLGGGVAANNLIFKVRKANAADPNQTITCRVFLERSGVAAYTQSIAFAGDNTLRFVCTAAIPNNNLFAVSFQPSGPIPNNILVSLTALVTRANI